MPNSRERISNFFKENKKLIEILDNLSKSVKGSIDDTSNKVWGILGDGVSIDDLKKYICNANFRKNLEKETKRKIKKILINIIRVLDGVDINNNKIHNLGEKIEEEISTQGISLEYFLIDIIERESKREKPRKIKSSIRAYKGPKDNDSRKIDFLVRTSHLIKLGIQLTISGENNGQNIERSTGGGGIKKTKEIYKKRGDMRKFAGLINNNSYSADTKKIMSIQFIPDIPVLVIVNGRLGQLTKTAHILKKAYLYWKNNGFPNGGPSEFLAKKLKNDIEKIGITMPIIIQKVYGYIKSLNHIREPKKILHFQKTGEIEIDYNNDSKSIKASFYEIKNGKIKEFIYSMEFFITDPFLNKLSKN